jgi:predicted ATPase
MIPAMGKVLLPVQLVPLIGRERELDASQHLLIQPYVRLITLTGPGGSGKISLAIQAAANSSGAFSDGVVFIPLETVRDHLLVIPSIARMFSLGEKGERLVLDRLVDQLKSQELLLLLDNFEQVIQAAPQLTELLASCPKIKLLVTSRQVLRLHGEYEFPVPPLELPVSADKLEVSTAIGSPAVALFVQRAQAVRPNFTLTIDNAPVVAEICIRLDGLPLAIELAAVRVRMFTPAAILPRLVERLSLLTSSPVDVHPRHKTLASAIGWSYDLLPPSEQSLFRRLSVFSGGFSVEAAEFIAGAELEGGMIDPLDALIQKSLIFRDETAGAQARYKLLETIREFGLEQLERNGEQAAVTRMHADYFRNLAEEAELGLLGDDQDTWLKRLETDYANLRAALTWLIREKDAGAALALAGSLWRFWLARAWLREGQGWLEQCLALPLGSGDEMVWAKAACGLGILSNYQGQYSRSKKYLSRSLECFRKLNDRRGAAVAMCGLAHAYSVEGEYEAANRYCSEAVELMRSSAAPAALTRRLPLINAACES